MNRSARLLAVPVIAACAVALAACGGGGSSTNTAGCTPKHSFPTVEEGKLTVSVYVSPPYTVQNGDQWGGVDGTVVTALAQMECLQLEAKPVAAAGLIASVQANRADLAIGGVYRTPERAQSLELSDTIYRDGMAVLSKSGAADVSALTDKTVGVVQGYLWNEQLQQVLGPDSVRIYQASDGMINDLSNGRLDAGILTTAEAAYRAQQNPGAGLQAKDIAPSPQVQASQAPGEVVLAMTQSNTAMAQAFNEDIKSLQADGTIAKALTDNGMNPGLAGSGKS